VTSEGSLTTPDAATVRVVLTHGRTATAFRALGGDLSRWHADAESFVAYATPSGAMVSAGEPVAPMDRLVAVADAFVDVALARGRRVSFFATEGRLATSARLSRRLIGEQPVWDPQQWEAHVRSHRSLREQLRRARAKGVVVHAVTADALTTPEAHAAVAALAARVGAQRSMPPMAFLVTVDLTTAAALRRYYVARQQGRMVAMLALAPVPAREGWLFEHLLRDPTAPNGTAELLVDHAMRAIAADGGQWATLGLAPLHGPVDASLAAVRSLATPLFNFAGLSAFKRKLRPTFWEPIYLAWPREQSGWRALIDGLRAFAGGSLLRFGLRTLFRGPTVMVQLLTWLLVPWTIALALTPTARWFPSLLVHGSWVAFDGALLLGLQQLGVRSRDARSSSRTSTARWATMLAAAVSTDAIVTLAEALTWNVPRAPDAASRAVIAAACVGPALASCMLWGAALRLRTLARPIPIWREESTASSGTR
jgi:phosphatidylglycerol lysyltransferase